MCTVWSFFGSICALDEHLTKSSKFPIVFWVELCLLAWIFSSKDQGFVHPLSDETLEHTVYMYQNAFSPSV